MLSARRVEEMTPDKVGTWLTTVGLGDYSKRFIEQKIDGQASALNIIKVAANVASSST
jgi:hypothetical protein